MLARRLDIVVVLDGDLQGNPAFSGLEAQVTAAPAVVIQPVCVRGRGIVSPDRVAYVQRRLGHRTGFDFHHEPASFGHGGGNGQELDPGIAVRLHVGEKALICREAPRVVCRYGKRRRAIGHGDDGDGLAVDGRGCHACVGCCDRVGQRIAIGVGKVVGDIDLGGVSGEELEVRDVPHDLRRPVGYVDREALLCRKAVGIRCRSSNGRVTLCHAAHDCNRSRQGDGGNSTVGSLGRVGERVSIGIAEVSGQVHCDHVTDVYCLCRDGPGRRRWPVCRRLRDGRAVYTRRNSQDRCYSQTFDASFHSRLPVSPKS